MAKNVMQLRQIIWLHLLLCWASVVLASEPSFVEGIETVPLKAFGYVFVLSVLGGMAATIPKILLPQSANIRSMWLEVIKDVVCSFVAGLLIFFFATWQKWPWALQCLLFLLGGAGNAKFIDIALNNGFFPRVAQALGKVPDPVVTPPPQEPQP